MCWIALYARNAHAEENAPSAQDPQSAADAEGYVWVDKDGKAHLSNLPRDANGAPIRATAKNSAERNSPPSPESAKGFYQWTDEKGIPHLTDRYAKVPEDRRDTIVFQPAPKLEAFDIELSPEVRALLRQEQLQSVPRPWLLVAGGVGVGALIVFFVFWRRHRKLRPDPTAFSKRVEGAASGVNRAGDAVPGEELSAEQKLTAHYKLIGVEPNALSSEVRKAYHRRMLEYHPDKVASLGKELRELADVKSREINVAYEAILFYRGEA